MKVSEVEMISAFSVGGLVHKETGHAYHINFLHKDDRHFERSIDPSRNLCEEIVITEENRDQYIQVPRVRVDYMDQQYILTNIDLPEPYLDQYGLRPLLGMRIEEPLEYHPERHREPSSISDGMRDLREEQWQIRNRCKDTYFDIRRTLMEKWCGENDMELIRDFEEKRRRWFLPRRQENG